MIFDCFTFFNELDLLEVRLNELSNVVDRFVLVESTETFQGKPKPLYFANNRERFAVFNDRIIHVVVEFPKTDIMKAVSTRPKDQNWAREHYQRDQISRGLVGAEPDDLIIVSDVDEIIRADALANAVATRSRKELTVFLTPVYWGGVTRRMNNEIWDKGSRMISLRQFTGGQRLRKTKVSASNLHHSLLGRVHTRIWNWLNTGINAPIRTLGDAGWHITNLGDWQAYRLKLSSFAHAELLGNKAYEKETEFKKLLNHLTREVSLSELPKFIQENPGQFGLVSW